MNLSEQTFFNQASKCTLLLCLLLPVTIDSGTAQSVELTSEIETIIWPFKDATGEIVDQINQRTWTIRCVVGTDTWLIEGDFIANGKETWWFTGTNMIRRSVITQLPSKGMSFAPFSSIRIYYASLKTHRPLAE